MLRTTRMVSSLGALALAALLIGTSLGCSAVSPNEAADTAETSTETGSTSTDGTGSQSASNSNSNSNSSGPGCTAVLPPEGPPENPYDTVVEPFEIVSPAGDTIYGMIRRPDPAQYDELCFPAVVMVPGGINPGRMEATGKNAKMLSAAGMVVVTFNAEGRVDAKAEEDLQSEGEEDYNGFVNQATLCHIVESTMSLPYVIGDNVGVSTQSYGITMGAGCAGRNPDIAIKYLVDGEGPPSSFVTCHEPNANYGSPPLDVKYQTIEGILGHYSLERDPSAANKAFWEQREAIRFIGGFKGRYLRLQAQWDHSQPPSNQGQIAQYHHPPTWWHNKHTNDIVNTAVEGGVPWVRVNVAEQNNAVNATYDVNNMPAFLPGKLADKPWHVIAVLEMARMP